MLGALFLSVVMSIVPVDPWNPPVVPECGTIDDLNPGARALDMVDWLTLDGDLRKTSHMQSEPPGSPPGAYVLGTVLTQDRMTYLKTLEGDTWDVNLIDDLGIWAWRTEDRWNNPRSFAQFRHVGQVMVAPRVGHGGYPGMRWVSCDTAYARHMECGAPAAYGHLGYSIGELWGPYDYDPGYGDVKGPILKMAYYYGCSSPSPESCSTVEVVWVAQRYGAFSWRQYDRRGGAWVLTNSPPITVYVAPGVITESAPCDAEVK